MTHGGVVKLHADRPRWRNELPAWIVADAAWPELRAGVRRTLQAIADACDPPDALGNLIGCWGGRHLVRAAEISTRTLWRHVGRLERCGFLVCLGSGYVYDGRNFGNRYGIPANRGALDSRRQQRGLQRMIRDANGKHRPSRIEPGEQGELFLANHQPVHRAGTSDLLVTHENRTDPRAILSHHH